MQESSLVCDPLQTGRFKEAKVSGHDDSRSSSLIAVGRRRAGREERLVSMGSFEGGRKEEV